MTKVGLLKTPVAVLSAARHGSRGARGRLASLAPGPAAATSFQPDYVSAAARRCLRRQRVDRLDALLLHEPSAAELREGAFLPALERLRKRGEIALWGASVRDAEAARAAVDLPGIGLLQVPCSAVDASVVAAVRTVAGERGIALVAIAALGDGQLLRRASALRPGVSSSQLVAELAAASLGALGVEAVLLGMSGPEHVREVLAALPDVRDGAQLAADLRRADDGEVE